MSCRENLLGASNSPSNFRFVECDVTSVDGVKFILQRYKINTIIHCAGETRSRESEISYSFTYNNVIATHVLLEVAKSVGYINLFIHLSSDEVYGKLSRPHVGPVSGEVDNTF